MLVIEVLVVYYIVHEFRDDVQIALVSLGAMCLLLTTGYIGLMSSSCQFRITQLMPVIELLMLYCC